MGKYNSTSIESLAVSKVTIQLAFMEGVSPGIPIKDKTPVWDGSIYLYNDDNEENSNMIGRVPAQVKGREVKKFEENIYYPVSVVDLRNILNDGGCIYFVVAILGYEMVIYYKLLAPESIKPIINRAQRQKTCNLKFAKMPLDEKVFRPMLIDFYEDCHSQKSFSGVKTISLSEMAYNNLPLELSVNSRGFKASGESNFMQYLSKKPVYLYYNDGSLIKFPVPLAGGPVTMTFHTTIQQPVIIDGKELYGKYSLDVENGITYLTFGNSIKIPLDFNNTDGQVGTVTLQLPPYLSKRIEVSKLLIYAHENSTVQVGNISLNVHGNTDHSVLCELRKSLPYWEDLYKTLQELGVKTDLDLTKVSKKDKQMCDALIDSVLHKKPFPAQREDNGVTTIEFANIRIIVILLKTSEKGFTICNVFNNDQVRVTRKDPDGKEQVASIFSYIVENHAMDYDNIPYDKIVASYESVKDTNSRLAEMANLDMLMMLNAYDKIKGNTTKKQLLIAAIKDLAQWVLDNNVDNNAHKMYIINQLQIKKRLYPLNEKDQVILKEYTADDNLQVRAVAHLLLEDYDAFKAIFSALDKDVQKAIKSFPIYYFAKNFKKRPPKA